MHKVYSAALWFRIIGISLSGIALLLTLFRPVDPVFAVGLVYTLLIVAALFIIIGQLLVIKFVPREEFKTKAQRTEAIYDVSTTIVVVIIFVIVYVIPFAIKYIK